MRRIALLATTLLLLGAGEAPKTHHVAVQVDDASPALMTLVLNNIDNLFSYYAARNEPVQVELVAFGPGLTMLRDDTSPVKPRLAAEAASHPGLVLSACENSRRGMSLAEGKEVPIVPQAHSTPSGVVRLTELQEMGYTYLRP